MHGRVLLIVEDDEDQAHSLAAVLGMLGQPCEVAGTLRAGLDRLSPAPGAAPLPEVACVVLDLTLPDSQGVAGVAAFQGSHPDTPVVVLTGYPDYGAEALRAGAQDVVLKPADPEHLLRTAQFAVERHRVRSTYRPYTDALEAARLSVDDLTERVRRHSEQSPKEK